MTKISDERLAEMLAYTPTHADNKADRVFYRELRLIIRELQQLRAHNSDSAEPVAFIENCDVEKLKSGESIILYARDSKKLGTPLYLASPPAKEVTEAEKAKSEAIELLLSAQDVWADYGSGFRLHFSFGTGSDMRVVERVNTARALTNRTPDDEVGNG